MEQQGSIAMRGADGTSLLRTTLPLVRVSKREHHKGTITAGLGCCGGQKKPERGDSRRSKREGDERETKRWGRIC